MNDRVEELLATAKRELAAGETAEKRADSHKWAAAEAMWTANNEENVPVRIIADEVGVSATTVKRYVRIWHKRVAGDPRSFAELYYDAQGHGPADREDSAVERAIRERPEEVAEKLAPAVGEKPEVADKIARNPKARMRMGAANYRAEQAAKDRFAAGEKIRRATNSKAEKDARTMQAFEMNVAFDSVVFACKDARRKYERALLEQDGEDREFLEELFEEHLPKFEAAFAHLRGETVGEQAEAWLAQATEGGE